MNRIFLFLCVAGVALCQDHSGSPPLDSSSSSASSSSSGSSSSSSSSGSSSGWYSDEGNLQVNNRFVRQGDSGGSVPADYQFKYDDGGDNLQYGLDLGFQERKTCPDADGSYTEYLPEGKQHLMEYKPSKYGYEPRISYTEPTSSIQRCPVF